MDDSSGIEKHALDGFPESAISFFRALEAERGLIATQHGLSEFDLRAVFRIAATGSMTPKQLALDLGVTKGAITGLATRLVATGLVLRADHPSDRRSLHLELTPEGHRAMRTAHDSLRQLLTSAGSSVADDDLVVAGRVLDALRDRIVARHDG